MATSPIREYRPQDREDLYAVCLRTGDSGADATGIYSEPDLLGEVFVGPYVSLEPSLARVLDDGSGVGGYVLAARDTTAFEAAAERSWWPAVRDRYPLASVAATAPEAWLVRMVHSPPRTPPTLVAAYPSHLHIDLLPQWQGGGWGRRLLEDLFERLAAAGSHGVHLGVGLDNVAAQGFYERLGFVPVDSDLVGDFLPGALLLGKHLT